MEKIFCSTLIALVFGPLAGIHVAWGIIGLAMIGGINWMMWDF